ncbi:MAG TPA: hypothetical protein VIG24_07950 [Acidimicrobiia bacterium]
MDRFLRVGLIVAVAVIALLIPNRATSETPPPVIEVTLSLTDLPTPVVNVTVPEQPAPDIVFPEQAAPVVNVTVPEQPAPVVNVDVESQEPQVVYQDREVEVERIVEVRTCLDFAQLPYFDLANALTVAFPGEPWSLSGSHYPGLVWYGTSPQPDMTAIIAGWLAHLESEC